MKYLTILHNDKMTEKSTIKNILLIKIQFINLTNKKIF